MKLRYAMLAIISCAAIALVGYCIHLNQKLIESENRIHQLQVENEEMKRKLIDEEMKRKSIDQDLAQATPLVRILSEAKGPDSWGGIGKFQPFVSNESDKK